MRLVTRSDFDGLICAVLLKEVGVIDSYMFAHPKDIQDGKVLIDENDVLANVPYWPGCGMWFDHHSSEDDAKMLITDEFKGESRPADSCSRIIYEYYGGDEKFPKFKDMIEAVDKSDAGKLSIEDIQHPQGWILLSFVMDPRSGFGRFKSYTISNYKLMENLIDYCRSMTIDEILADPDVMERIEKYRKHEEKYEKMLQKHVVVRRNCIIIDLRNLDRPYVGNRFTEYVMYPKQNISVRLMNGRKGTGKTVFAIGHSIINRTSQTNVGALCQLYGGGGHDKVGTCQVNEKEADRVLDEIVDSIIKAG